MATAPSLVVAITDPIALEDRLRAARARRAAAIASRPPAARPPRPAPRPTPAPALAPPAPDLPAGLCADELRAALAEADPPPASSAGAAPAGPRDRAGGLGLALSRFAARSDGLRHWRFRIGRQDLATAGVALAGLIVGMGGMSLWLDAPAGRAPAPAEVPAVVAETDFVPAAGRTDAGDALPPPAARPIEAAPEPEPEPAALAPEISEPPAAQFGPPPPPRPETVVLRSAEGSDPALLQEAEAALRTAGFSEVAALPAPAAFEASSIRFYHAADAEAAAAVATALGEDLPAAELRDFTGTPSRIGPGRLEVWLAPEPAVEAGVIRSLVDQVASERATARPAATAAP